LDSNGNKNADSIFRLQYADVIDLLAIDADLNTAGDQAFVIVDELTGAAGQLMLKHRPLQNTRILADMDGDAEPDLIIRLDGGHDHRDFTSFVL
jgi:hypothetical protein